MGKKITMCMLLFSLMNAVDISLDYLNIPLNPRGNGTGEVVLQTPYGFSENPASIKDSPSPYLSFCFLKHWADINIGNICYVKSNLPYTLVFDVFYLNSGKIKKTSEIQEDLGTYGVNYINIGVGVKKKIDKINIGIRIRSHAGFVDTVYNLALSMDAGIHFNFIENLISSFVGINHIGYELVPFIEKRNLLPVTPSVKISYRLDKLTIHMGAKYPINWGIIFGLGIEIFPRDFLSIRFGYSSRGTEQLLGYQGLDVLSGVGFGIGILDINKISLDYSFSYYAYTGSLHCIGIVYRLK